MATLIIKGGILSYLIILCSILALASFIERFIVIRKSKIDTQKFLAKIEELIRLEKWHEAVKLSKAYDSPIARIVNSALSHVAVSRDKMAANLEETVLVELSKLESRLTILATIAHIAPLLGLLGTVNGMIKAFYVIQQKSIESGVASVSDLSSGISMALVTTALGLAVAIPTIVAYNYIYREVEKIKRDMEIAATKIISLCT